jgi:hypothetical protein
MFHDMFFLVRTDTGSVAGHRAPKKGIIQIRSLNDYLSFLKMAEAKKFGANGPPVAAALRKR